MNEEISVCEAKEISHVTHDIEECGVLIVTLNWKHNRTPIEQLPIHAHVLSSEDPYTEISCFTAKSWDVLPTSIDDIIDFEGFEPLPMEIKEKILEWAKKTNWVDKELTNWESIEASFIGGNYDLFP